MKIVMRRWSFPLIVNRNNCQNNSDMIILQYHAALFTTTINIIYYVNI